MAFTSPDSSNLLFYGDAASLALADGAAVASWTDSNGGPNAAAQATSGKRPVYKTGIIKGNPVVRFDGVDDFLSFTHTGTIQYGTIIVIGRHRATANTYHVAASVQNCMASYLKNNDGTHIDFYTTAYTTGDSYAGGANMANDTPDHLIWKIYTTKNFDTGGGLGSTLYLNGVQSTVQVYGTANIVTNPLVVIGGDTNGGTGSSPAAIDIAEIWIYKSALSDGDRQTIEAYAAAKYGFTGRVGLEEGIGSVTLTGTLTSGAPGSFTTVTGSLCKRQRGPQIAAAAPGWSINVRGSAQWGKFTFDAGAPQVVRGYAHCYFRIGTAPGGGGTNYSSIVQVGNTTDAEFTLLALTINSNLRLDSWAYHQGGSFLPTAVGTLTLDTWYQCRIDWATTPTSGSGYSATFSYAALGASLAVAGTVTNFTGNTLPSFVKFGPANLYGLADSTGWKGRIGVPATYGNYDQSSTPTTTPAGVTPPTEAVKVFYLNPNSASASDSNNGLTNARPWKTFAFVNSEMLNRGAILAPAGGGMGAGDELIITDDAGLTVRQDDSLWLQTDSMILTVNTSAVLASAILPRSWVQNAQSANVYTQTISAALPICVLQDGLLMKRVQWNGSNLATTFTYPGSGAPVSANTYASRELALQANPNSYCYDTSSGVLYISTIADPNNVASAVYSRTQSWWDGNRFAAIFLGARNLTLRSTYAGTVTLGDSTTATASAGTTTANGGHLAASEGFNGALNFSGPFNFTRTDYHAIVISVGGTLAWNMSNVYFGGCSPYAPAQGTSVIGIAGVGGTVNIIGGGVLKNTAGVLSATDTERTDVGEFLTHDTTLAAINMSGSSFAGGISIDTALNGFNITTGSAFAFPTAGAGNIVSSGAINLNYSRVNGTLTGGSTATARMRAVTVASVLTAYDRLNASQHLDTSLSLRI